MFYRILRTALNPNYRQTLACEFVSYLKRINRHENIAPKDLNLFLYWSSLPEIDLDWVLLFKKIAFFIFSAPASGAD